MNTAERYVRLAHGVQAHHPGFVDSYCGDPAWARPLSAAPEALLEEAEALEQAAQGFAAPRRTFWLVQLRAMRTILRLSQGEQMPFADEVRGLYDIEPVHTAENVFEENIRALDELLPGNGPIQKRWLALRERFKVPPEHLNALVMAINQELRSRSTAQLTLPEHEDIRFELVKDKPWGGYNWYLGNAQSRVDINTDLPSYLAALPDLVAHEAYPGHHTERIFKEALRQRGWEEFSVQLLNAPEAVLSEGIATNALEQVMGENELQTWLLELAHVAHVSLSAEELALWFNANQARKALGAVSGNVALMVHQDSVDDQSALEYIQTHRLVTLEDAQHSLEFIKHPSSRSYIYNYSVGYELVKNALGANRSWATYQRLLAEPITPGQLRTWAG